MFTHEDYCCPGCGAYCTDKKIITSPNDKWMLYCTECDIEFETPDV